MNKDKQIEEMARSVCRAPNCKMIVCADLKEKNAQPCDKRCRAYLYAARFYNAGYRKKSEVAREIFCIIDDIVESWKLETRSKETGELIRTAYNGTMIAKCIAELKKKYTEDGE